MCCHLSVYAYWGYYWAPVYPYAPLLVGQLFFAYAFDMLLSWSRRQPYGLGFGPFPIVLSTNLFLWFKDDWFLFQFLLIAVGFLGKAFVRWERDGKRVHIFNPSAFTLALFSLVLIVTGTTDVTWAQEINTTFSLGPRMYTVLFLIGLVVMYFFAITPVTAMAAATLFGLSAALLGDATGVPYFVDSEIPTAVFLGLHLLVTDPSTSPRTPLGRAIFGVLYGVGVFALYALLDRARRADLLRQAAVRAAAQPAGAGDRSAGRRASVDRPLVRWLGLDPPIGHRNLAHMAVWIGFFALMTATGRTDGMHRGDALPFWQQACAEGRNAGLRAAAAHRGVVLRRQRRLGLQRAGPALPRGPPRRPPTPSAPPATSPAPARPLPGRLRQPARLRRRRPRANPRPLDLRLLLREGGPNLLDMPEPDLYARACRHGWSFACGKTVAAR